MEKLRPRDIQLLSQDFKVMELVKAKAQTTFPNITTPYSTQTTRRHNTTHLDTIFAPVLHH